PKGGRCGGNGGKGGSMGGRGDGWLAKRSIVSNKGCGSGRLAVHGGRSSSKSKKGFVWKVKMVPVEERSMVEELFWECSRDDLGRFLVK
ncbi:hypothetical protein Tco_0384279, partial [Tanacetum coccineum]